jgi:hypothetical protein
VASLYKKVISGKPYWYLREMGWAGGKPMLVSDRYLGAAADIEALLDAHEAAVLPSGPGTWRSGTWPQPGESCRTWAWPR